MGLDLENVQAINLPLHVAMIMDGNGRWARQNSLPRVEGHRQGASTVRMVVEECCRLGIKYLTLFAFSTENWQRPRSEVETLMDLLHYHLVTELDDLASNGVKVTVTGERGGLTPKIVEAIRRAEEVTKFNHQLELVLAISYGGRREIVEAARKLTLDALAGSINVDDINEESIAARLYQPTIPDPDLLIRTSSESRISNFLLWQLAYSEIIISKLHWPEFTKAEFYRCLSEYASRNRRFGKTSEQIKSELATNGINFNDGSSSTPNGEIDEGYTNNAFGADSVIVGSNREDTWRLIDAGS